MSIVVLKKQPFTSDEIQNIYNNAKVENRIIMNIPEMEYMDIYETRFYCCHVGRWANVF